MRDAVSVVVRETRRLIHLVDRILEFTRSERSLLAVAPTDQRLAPLIAEIVASFGSIANADEVTIAIDAPGDIAVAVDADALRHVLMNLLDNAVRYGPRGQTVRVGLTVVNGCARITVDDDGPGIRASDRGRVWRP